MTEELEEVEDIVVEFEGNFDLDTVLDKKLQFLGIDSKEPVLKIESKLYKITTQDSIGTRLLFKNQEGKLMYHGKTDKQITAHRVMMKPKQR